MTVNPTRTASDRGGAPAGASARIPSAVWPVWRAHRVALLVAAGIVLAAAVALVLLWWSFGRLGAGEWCSSFSGCAGMSVAGMRVSDLISVSTLVLLALPTATGAVLGAIGVAREAERGTLQLAMTQGLSTARWWFSTLLLLGGPLALAYAGLGMLAAWARQPVEPVIRSTLTTPYFETAGPVLGAYFLLAFTVSAALGVWCRNSVIALVGSVVGCAVLVLVGLATLRSHYAEPTVITRSLASELAAPDDVGDVFGEDWTLSVTYVTGDGRSMDSAEVRCSGDVPDEPLDTFWERCLRADAYTDEVTVFHAGGQWLRFQATESAVVLALTAVAGHLGYARLRRRPV